VADIKSESPAGFRRNPQPSELFLESDVLVLFELPETSCFLVFFWQFDSARRVVILCLWNVFGGTNATKGTSR
jgi:hypothetical protein